jgi:hypothetical protein
MKKMFSLSMLAGLMAAQRVYGPDHMTQALAGFTPDAISQYISTRSVNIERNFLARFLPPVRSTDADIRAGNIRIRSGIAGMTATDSPYAKVGSAKAEEFRGSTIKLTASNLLTERDQDALISQINQTILNNGNPEQVITSFISRFFEDAIQLSLDNGQEYYRAVALSTGKISGSFGGLEVDVDFQLPSAHKPAKVTGANSYAGATSQFWPHVLLAQQTLLGGEPQFILNKLTFNVILNNAANGVLTIEKQELTPTLTRYVVAEARKYENGTYDMSAPSLDVRKRAQLWVYSAYAENDDDTLTQFWPNEYMTALLAGTQNVTMIDGQIVQGALGVTHIGPNTESGGRSIRYGRIFRPENQPYQVRFEGAEDMLPHIREPRRMMVFQTNMTAA